MRDDRDLGYRLALWRWMVAATLVLAAAACVDDDHPRPGDICYEWDEDETCELCRYDAMYGNDACEEKYRGTEFRHICGMCDGPGCLDVWCDTSDTSDGCAYGAAARPVGAIAAAGLMTVAAAWARRRRRGRGSLKPGG